MSSLDQLMTLRSHDVNDPATNNAVDELYADACGALGLDRLRCDWAFFALLILFQVPFAVLCYEPDYYPLKWLVTWIERSPRRVANIKVNSAESHRQLVDAHSEPTTGLWVMFNVGIPLHHVLGCGFAGPAFYFGSTTLLRIAVSFEIGENLVHYVQMLWCWLLPPGPMPFNTVNRLTWIALGAHHFLGSWFGTFAFFMMPDWPGVQLITFFVYVCVLPHLFLTVPFQLMEDLSKPSLTGKWHAAMLWVTVVLSVYVRFYLYIEIALSVMPKVNAEFGTLMGGIFSVPLVIFGFSNIGFVGMGVAMAVKETQVQCSTICKRGSLRSSSSIHKDCGHSAPDDGVRIGPVPPLIV